jgi:hypothetical protein
LAVFAAATRPKPTVARVQNVGYDFRGKAVHQKSDGKGTHVEPKHSGLGIASFILSILTGVGAFVLVVVAGVVEASTPGGMDENSAVAVVIGLGIIGVTILEILALGLGVAGLLQSNRTKILAVLGVLFSTAALLGMAALFVIGTMLPD